MADTIFEVEEMGGDLYPDAQEAREAGLSVFADCLVASLNEFLDLGLLSVDGGVIVPAGAAADLMGVGRQLSNLRPSEGGGEDSGFGVGVGEWRPSMNGTRISRVRERSVS